MNKTNTSRVSFIVILLASLLLIAGCQTNENSKAFPQIPSQGQVLKIDTQAPAAQVPAQNPADVPSQKDGSDPESNPQSVPKTSVAKTPAPVKEEVIKIPLTSLSTTAKFFTEEVGGTTVRFFAVKASNGSFKTAFDACDVCYRFKKGYRQVGGEMVCNNCGRHFSIDSLGVENFGSGCWPSYLESRIEGDYLVISKAKLAEKAYLFE